MALPVDEMIAELRGVLEKFDSDPNDETQDAVFKELNRIGATCETCRWEDEG